MNIYIVSYVEDEVPVVTAFNNLEAAALMKKTMIGFGKEHVCLDEVPVYSSFTVSID